MAAEVVFAGVVEALERAATESLAAVAGLAGPAESDSQEIMVRRMLMGGLNSGSGIVDCGDVGGGGGWTESGGGGMEYGIGTGMVDGGGSGAMMEAELGPAGGVRSEYALYSPSGFWQERKGGVEASASGGVGCFGTQGDNFAAPVYAPAPAPAQLYWPFYVPPVHV